MVLRNETFIIPQGENNNRDYIYINVSNCFPQHVTGYFVVCLAGMVMRLRLGVHTELKTAYFGEDNARGLKSNQGGRT